MHSHILLIETIAVLSQADASSYAGHVISGTRYFDIDRESGQIIIQAPLDREQIAQYSIVVKVGFSRKSSYVVSNQCQIIRNAALKTNDLLYLMSSKRFFGKDG